MSTPQDSSSDPQQPSSTTHEKPAPTMSVMNDHLHAMLRTMERAAKQEDLELKAVLHRQAAMTAVTFLEGRVGTLKVLYMDAWYLRKVFHNRTDAVPSLKPFATCYDQVITGIKAKTFDKDQQEEQRVYLLGVVRETFKTLYDPATMNSARMQREMEGLELAESVFRITAEREAIRLRGERISAQLDAIAGRKEKLKAELEKLNVEPAKLHAELEKLERRKAQLGTRDLEIARRFRDLHASEEDARACPPEVGGSEAAPGSSDSATLTLPDTCPSTSAAPNTAVAHPPSKPVNSVLDMQAPTSASTTTDTAPPPTTPVPLPPTVSCTAAVSQP